MAADGDTPPKSNLSEQLNNHLKKNHSESYVVFKWTKKLEKKLLKAINEESNKNYQSLNDNSWLKIATKMDLSVECCKMKHFYLTSTTLNTKKLNESEISVLKEIHKKKLEDDEPFSWKTLCTEFNEKFSVKRNGKLLKRCEWQIIEVMMKEITKEKPKQKKKWTQEEDKLLTKAVSVLGDNWTEISELFPDRTPILVHLRWLLNICPKVQRSKRKFWTDVEKEKLERIVLAYEGIKPIPWTMISRHFENRTPHQCRERYGKNRNPKGRRKEKLIAATTNK